MRTNYFSTLQSPTHSKNGVAGVTGVAHTATEYKNKDLADMVAATPAKNDGVTGVASQVQPDMQLEAVTPATPAKNPGVATEEKENIKSNNNLGIPLHLLHLLHQKTDKADISQAANDSPQRQTVNGYGCQAAALVTCGACAHFQPDRIGDGTGIGRCGTGAFEQARAAWWRRIERLEALRKTSEEARKKVSFPDPPEPLYPGIERRCGEYQAKPSFSYCPKPVGAPLGSRKEDNPECASSTQPSVDPSLAPDTLSEAPPSRGWDGWTLKQSIETHRRKAASKSRRERP